MSTCVKLAAAAAVALGLSVAATPAQAALMQAEFVGFGKLGNDCSGYFGQGFDECTISITDEEGTHELSPVIAKWERDLNKDPAIDGITATNSGFTTVDGSEFDIVDDEWFYDPGEGDPEILYWVKKHQNGFTLYWEVAGDAIPEVCQGDAYNFACLDLAVAITSGEIGGDFSHLTFYDHVVPVPLPAGLLLFLTGLAGVGFLGRYKAKRREPSVV